MMQTATPNIRAVRAGKGRLLVVIWKNGAESGIDLSKHLATFVSLGPLVANDALFRTVKVGESGWSVHWPDESEFDHLQISSDTLWRLALEQGSVWLRTWRAARGMTQADAARALGVSPRMWRYYEAGSHLLPKTVRLACAGLDTQAEAA